MYGTITSGKADHERALAEADLGGPSGVVCLLVGQVVQPASRWQGLAEAVVKRFGVACEVNEWRDEGGGLHVNIVIDNRASKRARIDILTFCEGFVAARGGSVE